MDTESEDEAAGHPALDLEVDECWLENPQDLLAQIEKHKPLHEMSLCQHRQSYGKGIVFYILLTTSKTLSDGVPQKSCLLNLNQKETGCRAVTWVNILCTHSIQFIHRGK